MAHGTGWEDTVCMCGHMQCACVFTRKHLLNMCITCVRAHAYYHASVFVSVCACVVDPSL